MLANGEMTFLIWCFYSELISSRQRTLRRRVELWSSGQFVDAGFWSLVSNPLQLIRLSLHQLSYTTVAPPTELHERFSNKKPINFRKNALRIQRVAPSHIFKGSHHPGRFRKVQNRPTILCSLVHTVT